MPDKEKVNLAEVLKQNTTEPHHRDIQSRTRYISARP